jgi:hypothetical protein
MVAYRDLLVRAVPGKFVSRTPVSMQIMYIGRVYDPAGDPRNLETEFPILPDGERVQATHRIRKEIADGELEKLGEVG